MALVNHKLETPTPSNKSSNTASKVTTTITVATDSNIPNHSPNPNHSATPANVDDVNDVSVPSVTDERSAVDIVGIDDTYPTINPYYRDCEFDAGVEVERIDGLLCDAKDWLNLLIVCRREDIKELEFELDGAKERRKFQKVIEKYSRKRIQQIKAYLHTVETLLESETKY